MVLGMTDGQGIHARRNHRLREIPPAPSQGYFFNLSISLLYTIHISMPLELKGFIKYPFILLRF